jgi:hypothetical protein
MNEYNNLKDAESSPIGIVYKNKEDGKAYVNQSYGTFAVPQMDVCPCCGTLVWENQIKKDGAG